MTSRLSPSSRWRSSMRSWISAPFDRMPTKRSRPRPTNSVPTSVSPLKETPFSATSLKETPLNETPLKETPLKETPLNETPLNETPLNETPLNDTPFVLIVVASSVGSTKTSSSGPQPTSTWREAKATYGSIRMYLHLLYVGP